MPIAFAPGRIELLGNHTDYNGGCVIAFATGMGVTAEGDIREDFKVQIRSAEFGEDSFSSQSLSKNVRAPWSDPIKGVIDQMEKTGAPLGGFDAQFTSNIPPGTGIHFNATLSVATALLLQKLFNFQYGDMETPSVRLQIATLCQAAENQFGHGKCSLLDPAISLLGRKDHAVFFDCHSHSIEYLPIHPDICFVICDTGVKHMLLSSKYNARFNECQEAVHMLKINKIPCESLRDMTSEQIRLNAGIFSPRVFQRAMHVTTENERVLAAREAMLRGDLETLGRLMFESHDSSREAFENSTDYLDHLVHIARSLPGCIGARLTGGGFGGATLSMVFRNEAEAFMLELSRQYREASGKEPTTWIVDAVDGAA